MRNDYPILTWYELEEICEEYFAPDWYGANSGLVWVEFDPRYERRYEGRIEPELLVINCIGIEYGDIEFLKDDLDRMYKKMKKFPYWGYKVVT